MTQVSGQVRGRGQPKHFSIGARHDEGTELRVF